MSVTASLSPSVVLSLRMKDNKHHLSSQINYLPFIIQIVYSFTSDTIQFGIFIIFSYGNSHGLHKFLLK